MAGVLGAALPAATACLGLGSATTVSLPEGVSAQAVELVDVNGDGRTDLVCSAQREAARSLRIHLRSSTGRVFRDVPDFVLDVTRDVVAFAVADVHSDPGREVLLFTANTVAFWRPRASGERDRYGRLLEVNFLWQFAGGETLWSWQQGVRDLDGDGRIDLLIPEPGGYRVAMQSGKGDAPGGTQALFDATSLLRLPHEPTEGTTHISIGLTRRPGERGPSSGQTGEMRASSGELSFAFEIAGGDGGALLSVRDKVPVPQIVDWDADGDLDVVAQGVRQLHVWRQNAQGRLPSAPDHSLALPVVRNRGTDFDVSYGSHLRDLDADGRADCVILAGDKRSDDVRTQILVFLQTEPGALFGDERGLPSQLLVLAGFVSFPKFVDVDGDGFLDLVVYALRPDLIDALRAVSSKKLDIELHVFRNRQGVFSKRPDFTADLAVPVEGSGFRARFLGDVTGDGISDLVVRDEDDRLRFFMVRRQKDGFTRHERALFELDIPEHGSLQFAGTRTAPELIVRSDDRIVHISFP